MKVRRYGFGRSDVVVLCVIPVLLAGIVAAAIAAADNKDNQRISHRQVNRISVAQQNYATEQNARGKPEAFVRGTEAFCQPNGKPAASADQATDPSRAFVYLVKKELLESLADLASPTDPFVAALSATAKDLKQTDVDFPVEGKPLGGAWAAADSPAAKEKGHTFYSYSMPSGSADKGCNLGTRMHATMPLAADRNPYGEIFKELAKEDVTKNSAAGNPWNNNREGVIYSQRDGASFLLKNANEFQFVRPEEPEAKSGDTKKSDEPSSKKVGVDPLSLKKDSGEVERDPRFAPPPPPPPGYDYLYGDAAMTKTISKPTNGKNVKRGEAGTAKSVGVWMID